MGTNFILKTYDVTTRKHYKAEQNFMNVYSVSVLLFVCMYLQACVYVTHRNTSHIFIRS